MRKLFVLAFLTLSTVFAFSQTLKDARKLTENEQFEAATAIFEALIKAEPSNGNNYYYFGKNMLLADNPDSAEMIFKKGLQADPQNALLKIGHAAVLLNTTNILEAKVASEKEPANPGLKTRHQDAIANVGKANALIDEATASAPKNADVFIEAANAYIHYENKNLDKAKEMLDKAAGLDASNPEINILYGDLYAEKNNGTLSADYYNRALEQNKSSARAIVSKGKLYMRSTNYEGAAREFEDAIKLDPGYAPAYRELGESYFRLGRLREAKEQYAKYLELSKNNCSARIRYASFLYLSKNYNEALTELEHVRQRCDSNNLTMLRVRSYCYYETEKYDEGLQTIDRLFSILPEEKRAAVDFEYYGKLLIANDQDSLGIEQLRKAYALKPERKDILSEIANAWIKLKNYPNAIAAFLEITNSGGTMKLMDYYNLGRAYYYNRQFLEADTSFKKVTEAAPSSTSGWLWLAKANTQIDSTSEQGLAKPYYEKYIELATADTAAIAKFNNGLAEAYGYLAYYYILLEDKENALLYLQKKRELRLEPEDRQNTEDGIKQLEKELGR